MLILGENIQNPYGTKQYTSINRTWPCRDNLRKPYTILKLLTGIAKGESATEIFPSSLPSEVSMGHLGSQKELAKQPKCSQTHKPNKVTEGL